MSPLQILKGHESEKPVTPESKRNRHRRLQAQIATVANTVITMQAILGVWMPGLREGLESAWPILTTVFAFNAGIVMQYLYVGSQENRHAAELQMIHDDPRLRKDFRPTKVHNVTPPGPRFGDRDDSPQE